LKVLYRFRDADHLPKDHDGVAAGKSKVTRADFPKKTESMSELVDWLFASA
jgi:hypothetical protein